MSSAKKSLLGLLVVGLAGLAAVATLAVLGSDSFASPRPCSEPIAYSIGEVDPRFQLSKEAFQKATADAAALWSEAAGKQLFVYDPSAELSVHLQYDDRQQTTDIARQIDIAQASASSDKAKIAQLRADLDRRAAAYEVRVDAFNTRADAYQQDVAYWNNRGGAPEDEFTRLQNEQRSLERLEGELRRESRDLDALASAVGSEAASVNEQIDALNQQVETFNASVPEEFEQGYYAEDQKGKRIVIFEFESRDELVWVLAHELGHALGIDHVDDPRAIMAAFNANSTPALTDVDRAALAAVCGS